MADCLALILQGDILNGITCTWTNVIGQWFYVIMLLAFQITLYIKYENTNAPAVLGAFTGLLMLSLLPAEAWSISLGVLIFNIAIILYSVYHLRD